jgi:hypothetical protein
MASDKGPSVSEYLDSQPEDRRKTLAAVRKVIRDNLPDGYAERVGASGMILYEVPLSRYPTTYNKQPLQYVALAPQKTYYALYLSAPYASSGLLKWFTEAYRKSGKKLDMGKSCVRFKSLEDLPLDVIGQCVARVPVDDFVAMYEEGRKAAKGR